MRPTDIEPKNRIVLALDVSSITTALPLAQQLVPHVGLVKVGLEFIYSSLAGMLLKDEQAAFVRFTCFRELFEIIGVENIFLDVKLDDIHNTVKKASLAISGMGVQWFNVHASAGVASIQAAVANRGRAKVFGVTVLTSTSAEECVSIFGAEPNQKVARFALSLANAGADGIICSPREVKLLRADHTFDHMIIATPGIRMPGSPADDQKRTMTPIEAIRAGADYLVVGRPIIDAEDPVKAAQIIAEEIRQA